MDTFYFNTGVKPWNNSFLAPGDMLINNERHIPFDCEDVPAGSTFAFCCDNPNLHPEAGYIVRKMYNTTMLSEYAYFRKPYPL
jgi:hypothetical protein